MTREELGEYSCLIEERMNFLGNFLSEKEVIAQLEKEYPIEIVTYVMGECL